MLLKNIHKTNRKIPVLESVFNSEYCKTFKSTHFEEHMRTAASENVFMKLRKIYSSEVLTLKTQVFQHQYQEQVKMLFPFHDWFPMKFLITYYIFLVWGYL